MSPILAAQLPLGLADLVAFPTTAEDIAAVVGAATRHGVVVTPRGKGTGNYGQAIPLQGGLVLDTSRARAIVEVGEGVVTAEAGATMVSLEQAAWATGQALWMYPSTAQSSIGGFLAGGSGGTGTIEHGANHAGFVVALDVVHADGSGELLHVEGEAAQAYVHNYGTVGIIARATVRLEPLRDWRALYASFPDFSGALEILRRLGSLTPPPRLVSADNPVISSALPADPAIPVGRTSLRALVSADQLDTVREIVEGAGGVVEDVREGQPASIKVSMLSYNHPIEWLQRSMPEPWFHVEVGGHALVERIDEVEAVFSGGLLHIEAGHVVPIGMLAARYSSEEEVMAGIERLGELGVGVHNPHQWNVDFELERTIELARTTDPLGLLNPGKLNPDYTGPRKGAIR
ncbi:FAD-binding oxidoreductase [Rathayibacter sp. Leaf296]|uniref:FAD-binding oxidoreductase n=1 Tax=Rathayibacter sp. Leaf296 TaxID=1736327 RepID=UPI001F44F060|nr:FAD-binding oxidoreductase [Rathayibacter sp. Leaf296]